MVTHRAYSTTSLEANWLARQQELVALSHNSKHIIAAESDHSIQDCQPALVVDVIRQMVQRWNNMQANLLIPESAWVVNDYPSEQTIQMLRERLREYNATAANTRDGCQLALFLHDEQGDMMSQFVAASGGMFWKLTPYGSKQPGAGRGSANG